MSCLDYFYFLLSRKDYSASELRKKGQEKGFGNVEMLEAIAQIQDRGYQSDTRLVANSIASAAGKYGKSAVKRKCLQKGISSDLFEEVWESESAENVDSEAEKLAELKAKVMRKYKIDAWDKVDPKTKGKVLNYLQYRGFNGFEIWRQWQMEEEED
ncbi:regulatory protein RecX [Tychonema sp. BBK16]|uniref:regulatory protein RecX n=1 Tax=Tychonema sp. BBK16 TaxID=2699888 RepID=UPI001F3CC527|nr:RecX family transcriptional regulator [Tychonema sp. BBK16]MCF6373491.1 RecX family transcriptional regulator [Tychonema sp. BBK16]